MTTTSILGITEVASNQNQKELTINNALEALAVATQDKFDVTFTANAATLTSLQYTRAVFFVAGTLSGAGTLTVPATKRLFVVDNSGNGNSPAHDLNVGAAVTGSVAVVSGGDIALLYCNGVDVLAIAGGSGGGGGGAGVTSFNSRTGVVTLTAADFAALDLSGLPTSNPGGGLAWINGGGGSSGAVWVGAP